MIFRQPAFSSLFYFQDPIGQSLLVIDPGLISYDTISDEKLKENITDARDDYIKDILKIKLNKYSLKSDELKYTKKWSF